jgi:hypothetical protein
MPKNPFQRPQPINHNHNVPRHGTQQQRPPVKVGAKVAVPEKPGLPALEKLLGKDRQQ